MMYSIVVSTKNRQEHLDWCLTGILQQEYKEYEAIVIDCDNLPLSGVPKEIKIVRRREGGWNQSAVLNMGLAHTKGDRIIVLGCDNIMAPDLLGIVHDTWQDGTQFYWRRFDLNMKGLEYARSNLASCFESEDWVDGHGEWHGLHAYGDFMATDRAKLLEIGGFDEEMDGWGFYDFDMKIRLARCGYEPKWGMSLKLLHQYHELFLTETGAQRTHDRNRAVGGSKGGTVRNQGPQTFNKYLRRQT